MKKLLYVVAVCGLPSIAAVASCGGDSDVPPPVSQNGGAGGGGGTAGDASAGGPSGGQGGSAAGGGGQGGSAAGAGGDGGSAGGSGQGGSAAGAGGQGGSAGATGCSSAADCSDSLACTMDACLGSKCVHQPGPNSGATACPAGQYCDVKTGCQNAPACGNEQQCSQIWGADACKTSITCDAVTATCVFLVLDKDSDGIAPVVCGGADCNDADATVYNGATELCDGKDNDCDGSVDEGASCPTGKVCQAGGCACLPEYTCGSICTDKSQDPMNCGSCGHACSGSCTGGICDPTCVDKVKNSAETDVDCGGPKCPKCMANKACVLNTDCSSLQCVSGKCKSLETLAFAPAVNHPAGMAPWFAAPADLNGDGKVDIAAANQGADTVSVLIGLGSGAFSAGTPFSAGSTPVHVTAHDMNADGILDLVTANTGAANVSLLIGKGNGTFLPKIVTPVGVSPYATAAGELSGDGHPDLAVVNTASDTLTILRGDGHGAFVASAPLPTDVAPCHIIAVDLNGDSLLDLVHPNQGSGTVSIRLNAGAGQLKPPTSYPTGSTPRSVAAGDLNGDGKPDLAIANVDSSPPTVTLLMSSGSSFVAATPLASDVGPRWVVIDDFNLDGKMDVAVANNVALNVRVFVGDGLGGFLPSVDFPCSATPQALSSADVNGDGLPDLIVAGTYVQIILNTSH